MSAVELKADACPNPWCESHKYGAEGAPTSEDIMWMSGTENRLVGCAYCDMQGPVGKDEAEAVALWNDRPRPPQGDAASIALREAFEAEQDVDTFTIRFPDGHGLTAWADGRLVITKVPKGGFAPFEVNIAALSATPSDSGETP